MKRPLPVDAEDTQVVELGLAGLFLHSGTYQLSKIKYRENNGSILREAAAQ